jgi:predicted O-methyltransferase YrrM
MKEKLETLFQWPQEKPSVPKDSHNWFGNDNAHTLRSIIYDIQPKYILEMGSWTGAGSTLYIAKNAPEAQIVCIDHWSRDMNDYVQDEFNLNQVKELWPQISVLWETFLVNLWEHKHHITPLRMKTVDGLKLLSSLNIPFNLIYIDAHHDYDSVLHDIEISHKNWPNAVIVGDDYTWQTVRSAVHHYADNNNLEVVVNGNCWYYLKRN